MRLRIGVLGIVSFVLLSTLSAGDVAAGSGLAVAQCTWVQGGSVQYGYEGMINDSTSSTAFIDCGVPMPAVTSPATVSVNIYDNNLNADVICRVQMRNANGSLALDAGNQFTSSFGAATLTWNVNGVSGTMPYVSCTVPPKSAGVRSGIANLSF